MARIAYEELLSFGTRLLTRLGASEPDARYMAEVACTTEAAGLATHGVTIFAAFAALVAGGGIDPKAAPAVVRERGSMATIDGRRCFSPLAVRLATRLAIEKARANGIAMVGVRNTSWLGGLGAYLLPIASQGLFAMLWAQSSQCLDSVPPGGIDARFSTNPVALAFPTAGEPVVADFSTATYSMGKVHTMAKAGQKAPEPVFFDQDGRLTDDPKVVVDRRGAMLMAGGRVGEHKGYALSLWCEALTAMAGGSCNNPQLEQRQSFNLTVIDPAAFEDTDYYRREMARFVAHVKTSRPRPGVDEIRLPGERMLRNIAASKARGVEVAGPLLDRLTEAAKQHNVAPPKVMN